MGHGFLKATFGEILAVASWFFLSNFVSLKKKNICETKF